VLGGRGLRGGGRRHPRPHALNLLLLATLGCGRASDELGPQSSASTAEPACGRIVFVTSEGHGHGHDHARISVVPAAGGTIATVTTTSADSELSEFPARVSPDGRTLLSLSSQTLPDGQTLDAFGLVDLAALPGTPRPIGPQAQLRNPSWSPDGQWLVFESNAASFRDLYRLDLASGSILRLTDDPQGNFEPAISPDGQRIAFVSSRDGNAEIYVMTSDGGSPQRLTHALGDDSAPTWSPDGRTIAFLSARERERGIDVFVMDGDGAGQRPLVDDPTRTRSIIARDATFSPDGSRLAFTQLVPGGEGGGVVIVATDTGEVVARTTGEPVDDHPSWSPDGRWLVFARSRGEERSDIARMRADGSELELITDGQGVHWLPRWIADPGCPRAPSITLPVAPAQG
jgi:TolB protein